MNKSNEMVMCLSYSLMMILNIISLKNYSMNFPSYPAVDGWKKVLFQTCKMENLTCLFNHISNVEIKWLLSSNGVLSNTVR